MNEDKDRMVEDKPLARGDARTSLERDRDGPLGTHPVGTAVGGVAGAVAAGAAVGSVAGPIGTAVGAAIGAVAGGMGGKLVADMIDPADGRRVLAQELERPEVRRRRLHL